MACRKLQPPLSASPLPAPLHPFSLSVDIAGDQPDLSAADFLEKQATLTVWQGTVPQRYLHGIITGMQAGENNDWQMNYHLTLSSPLWRCGLRQNFRIFQQQDIQTISSTLLAENGVTDWVPSFMNPIRRGSSAYSTGRPTSAF
jgi:type VI secretion system secreted protein VgrG